MPLVTVLPMMQPDSYFMLDLTNRVQVSNMTGGQNLAITHNATHLFPASESSSDRLVNTQRLNAIQ